MAEDEHQRGEERSEPEGGEGRPFGPMEEEEPAPRPTDDRDPSGPGGEPEQPPPPGTEPQAPAHETALAEMVPETGPGAIEGAGAAGGTGGPGGRLEELMAKRRSKGLTDDEAEELGRLLADQEGQPHSSAQSLKRGPASAE
jgi:hypothetical protein